MSRLQSSANKKDSLEIKNLSIEAWHTPKEVPASSFRTRSLHRRRGKVQPEAQLKY